MEPPVLLLAASLLAASLLVGMLLVGMLLVGMLLVGMLLVGTALVGTAQSELQLAELQQSEPLARVKLQPPQELALRLVPPELRPQVEEPVGQQRPMAQRVRMELGPVLRQQLLLQLAQ